MDEKMLQNEIEQISREIERLCDRLEALRILNSKRRQQLQDLQAGRKGQHG
jgi:prefoldin subunit 5